MSGLQTTPQGTLGLLGVQVWTWLYEPITLAHTYQQDLALFFVLVLKNIVSDDLRDPLGGTPQ